VKATKQTIVFGEKCVTFYSNQVCNIVRDNGEICFSQYLEIKAEAKTFFAVAPVPVTVLPA
jgi:hypothetical protein